MFSVLVLSVLLSVPSDVFVLLPSALPLIPGLYPARSSPTLWRPQKGQLPRPWLAVPTPWPSPPAPGSFRSFIGFLLSCPSPRAPASGGREAGRTLLPLFKVSRLVSQEGAHHGHLVSALPCLQWITMNHPGRAVGGGGVGIGQGDGMADPHAGEGSLPGKYVSVCM